jgi:hypothetical protein
LAAGAQDAMPFLPKPFSTKNGASSPVLRGITRLRASTARLPSSSSHAQGAFLVMPSPARLHFCKDIRTKTMSPSCHAQGVLVLPFLVMPKPAFQASPLPSWSCPRHHAQARKRGRKCAPPKPSSWSRPSPFLRKKILEEKGGTWTPTLEQSP